jgi:hypothetical protein
VSRRCVRTHARFVARGHKSLDAPTPRCPDPCITTALFGHAPLSSAMPMRSGRHGRPGLRQLERGCEKKSLSELSFLYKVLYFLYEKTSRRVRDGGVVSAGDRDETDCGLTGMTTAGFV